MPKMPYRIGFAIDMRDELEAYAHHRDLGVSQVLRQLVRKMLEKARAEEGEAASR